MTHRNYSREQFTEEKLPVSGMTLEEPNRSQWEEGHLGPLSSSLFFFFKKCVIIYIFLNNYLSISSKINVSPYAKEIVALTEKDPSRERERCYRELSPGEGAALC